MSARVCFYANDSFYNREQRGYIVVKITEDEAGYEETFGLHPTAVEAERIANKLNESNGLIRDEVLDIVASCMRAGTVR